MRFLTGVDVVHGDGVSGDRPQKCRGQDPDSQLLQPGYRTVATWSPMPRKGSTHRDTMMTSAPPAARSSATPPPVVIPLLVENDHPTLRALAGLDHFFGR